LGFNQAERLVVHRLDINDEGVINFDVAGSSAISLSPIPVAFTPTGGGTGVVISGPAFSGRYTLVGNLCYFSYQVIMTNFTNFGTGQFYMDLPFPTLKPFLSRNGCLHDTSTTNQYHITGHAYAGTTRMDLFTTDGVANRHYDFAFKQGEPIALSTADTFHIEGVYEADLSGV
jgi:hypothetical protein